MKIENKIVKPPPPPSTREIVITLTPEEAALLMSVVGSICSDKRVPERTFTDMLYDKLSEVGVKYVCSLQTIALVAKERP